MQKIQRLFPLLVGGVVAVGTVLAVASLAWSGNATASPVPATAAPVAAGLYLAAPQLGTGRVGRGKLAGQPRPARKPANTGLPRQHGQRDLGARCR